MDITNTIDCEEFVSHEGKSYYIKITESEIVSREHGEVWKAKVQSNTGDHKLTEKLVKQSLSMGDNVNFKILKKEDDE